MGPVGPSFYERPPTLDEPRRTNHDRESGKHHRDGKLYVLALTDTKSMGEKPSYDAFLADTGPKGWRMRPMERPVGEDFRYP